MDKKELSGRISIVTGAGGGIGRGIALALAHEGSAVVINDIAADKCQAVAEEIRRQGGKSMSAVCDISDGSAVKVMVDRVVAEFGSVDILVNNAAILYPTSPLESISDDEWDKVMRVNLYGAFHCTKAVLPYMKERRWGKIVNISSIAARSTSLQGGAHYTASKAALLGLTRHTARECGSSGINANAVTLAAVATDMSVGAWSEERIRSLKDSIPLGRTGTVEDIANLVVFLVSEKSSFITGATVDINGGLLMV